MRPLAACLPAVALLTGPAVAVTPDPFAWLQAVVPFDDAARSRIEQGDVVVRVLPAVDAEVGIAAASRLDADAELLVDWASSIDQLKKSRYVLAVRRFADPPSLEDLQSLQLDDDDLNAVRRCTPGDCELKLAADEIRSLREAAEEGGAGWKDEVQQQFRRVVLQRVVGYQVQGFAALSPYVDRRKASDPRLTSRAILGRSPFLTSDVFTGAWTESFFYWSKEQYGTGKPVIGVTHVEIVRPRVEGGLRVAVVSREILATHYRTASLGVTAVSEDDRGQRYLVYVNRSQLDVLGGLFGGWKRSIVEGRLKHESAGILSEVRRRLESGPPPE